MKTLMTLCAIVSSLSFAAPFSVNDIEVDLQTPWTTAQSALDQGTAILRFSTGTKHVQFYSKAGSISPMAVFVNGTQVQSQMSFQSSDLNWNIITTAKKTGNQTSYTTGFFTEYLGRSYYGYTRASQGADAEDTAKQIISSMRKRVTRSLTGPDYTGQKYYLGWGAAGPSDPSMMQNEVKYDVLHTHDIFTKDLGGSYIGTKYTSYKDANLTNIKAAWTDIGNKITSNDMYVQYSSGHGSETGLGVGLSYTQMRDRALSFGAKETIIFVMACHSGGLVNAFKEKQAQWQNFKEQGKTLFVMTSSDQATNSTTGPGTDPDQPGGSEGTAGSAFGHALWKALIGYADGEVDGVKDGYLSLEEIEKFTKRKTYEVSGKYHTPVSTGSYDPMLIMNRVPPKNIVDRMEAESKSTSSESLVESLRGFGI